MTKQRERFQAWFDAEFAAGRMSMPDDDAAWAAFQYAEAQAMERCAKRCDDYAVDRQALFDGRPPYAANDEGCAEPHTQGESDGAESCAELIRAMMKE